MTARVQIIQDWPAQMQLETVLAYLDTTRSAFDMGIKNGRYPAPYRIKGEGKRWLRTEIDQALAAMTVQKADEIEFE